MNGLNELFQELPPEGTSKKKPRHTAVVFKPDHKKQTFLLPPSIDELIGMKSLARFINEIVDRIDFSFILKKYQGGGASAYHPAMLLKVWLLGWCRKIYTSRQLGLALCRDLEFMWISGMQKPSHMTLNAFRKKLGNDIKTIFKETVKMALAAGIIDGKEIYIDHTKIEADVNRHKVTWAKNIARYMAQVDADLDKALELIDVLNEQENTEYANEAAQTQGKSSLSPGLLDDGIAKINAQIKASTLDQETGKNLKATLKKGKKRLEKKAEYEEKIKKLDGRNSMSNTDSEATAMMQKDQVSIKPGFNVGISTQAGIVTGYDISNNSNDSVSFSAVLCDSRENVGRNPERVCTDAGYGTHENYKLLDESNIDAYVKYPNWLRDEQGKRGRFEAESFAYDPVHDTYQCPNGLDLVFKGLRTRVNKRTGFVDTTREYSVDGAFCQACPFKVMCTKSAKRTIQVNEKLNEYRKRARERLASETGKRMRSQRSIEVETIFGIQKRNYGFQRLHIRGFLGATIECGLFYTALNITRLFKIFIAFFEPIEAIAQ